MTIAKVGRREAMTTIGAAGAALAFGCSESPTDPGSTSSVVGNNAACAITPTETEGPFPSVTSLIRSDIREGKPGTTRTLTQMAFPDAVNATVHTTGVYASRGTNPIANVADGILSDSLSSELVTPSGSAPSGYAATFQVGIAT